MPNCALLLEDFFILCEGVGWQGETEEGSGPRGLLGTVVVKEEWLFGVAGDRAGNSTAPGSPESVPGAGIYGGQVGSQYVNPDRVPARLSTRVQTCA